MKPVAPVGDPALAFGSNLSLPSSSEGVVATAAFGVHIRAQGAAADYGTGGSVRGTLALDGRDEPPATQFADVRAATTPDCGDGTGVLVGASAPPQGGDTIVFVESASSSRLPTALLFASQHASVLAVRQLGGREVAVLPFRFCGADGDDLKPASTVDVVPTADGKLLIMPASGAGARIVNVPWTTSAAELARTMRRVAADRPIARVRVTSLYATKLPAQHLVDVLSAAVLADVPTVELQGMAHAGYQLSVIVGGIAAAKHVDPANVRQAILNARDGLVACYEHAAFTLPTLDGSVPVRATVAADGKVTATVPADVGDEMATCVRTAFESLAIEGVRKPGSFTATVDLKRTAR